MLRGTEIDGEDFEMTSASEDRSLQPVAALVHIESDDDDERSVSAGPAEDGSAAVGAPVDFQMLSGASSTSSRRPMSSAGGAAGRSHSATLHATTASHDGPTTRPLSITDVSAGDVSDEEDWNRLCSHSPFHPTAPLRRESDGDVARFGDHLDACQWQLLERGRGQVLFSRSAADLRTGVFLIDTDRSGEFGNLSSDDATSDADICAGPILFDILLLLVPFIGRRRDLLAVSGTCRSWRRAFNISPAWCALAARNQLFCAAAVGKVRGMLVDFASDLTHTRHELFGHARRIQNLRGEQERRAAGLVVAVQMTLILGACWGPLGALSAVMGTAVLGSSALVAANAADYVVAAGCMVFALVTLSITSVLVTRLLLRGGCCCGLRISVNEVLRDARTGVKVTATTGAVYYAVIVGAALVALTTMQASRVRGVASLLAAGMSAAPLGSQMPAVVSLWHPLNVEHWQPHAPSANSSSCTPFEGMMDVCYSLVTAVGGSIDMVAVVGRTGGNWSDELAPAQPRTSLGAVQCPTVFATARLGSEQTLRLMDAWAATSWWTQRRVPLLFGGSWCADGLYDTLANEVEPTMRGQTIFLITLTAIVASMPLFVSIFTSIQVVTTRFVGECCDVRRRPVLAVAPRNERRSRTIRRGAVALVFLSLTAGFLSFGISCVARHEELVTGIVPTTTVAMSFASSGCDAGIGRGALVVAAVSPVAVGVALASLKGIATRRWR